MPKTRPFLTAEWRYLLMLNYEVDPAVLMPFVPAGTTLDLWQGKALASVVGFRFLRTRLLGIPVPFHTNFEEVNLRFYVARETPEGPRRGVVFIKEIVPRFWISQIARWVYRENYAAMRMGHTIETKGKQLRPQGLVEYTWRHQGRINRLGALAHGEAEPLTPDSKAAFITEHFWGYTRLGPHRTGEYRVAHPAWLVRPVVQPYLLCDVRGLYGKAFEPFLHHRPRSAFLAEGSAIEVHPGQRFRV